MTKFFIVEIYSKPSKKKHETNKGFCSHIDELWGIDLAEIIDYKNSINKGFRHVSIKIDYFSLYLWCISLKNKNNKTIT